MSRRAFLRLGAATTLLGTLGGLGACATREPLRVGVQRWVGYQFLSLADHKDWFRNGSVRLVPVAGANEVRAALLEGRVDAATVTLDDVLRVREQGVPLDVILVCNFSAGSDVLLAKRGLGTPADLRGRRIGVESTTFGALVLGEVLRATGLRHVDVEVVPIDEDHFAAWGRGDLDAVLTYGLAAVKLRKQGLVPVLDSRALRPVIVDTVAVRTDRAHGHHAALRLLVGSHFRALELWQRNPLDTAYALAPLLDMQSHDVRQLFVGLDLPDLAHNRRLLTPPATELSETARNVGSILVDAGLLGTMPATNRLFTAAYLPE